MGKYLDFLAVKQAVSMEQAVAKLGLTVVKSSNQLRGACPSCKQGGERALAITPSKQLFYCFADQKGGDQIALAAHILGLDTKSAAEWLVGTSTSEQVPDHRTVNSKDRANSPSQPGMTELDYLAPEHEAVAAVGFDEATARALGIGYANRGIMRGTVAVPIRLPDGSLVGYIGIIEARLPTRFHIPGSNVVKLKTG